MKIFVDVQGTVLGNAAASTQDIVQAILNVEPDHHVVFVSSDPKYSSDLLGGAGVVMKELGPDLVGAVLIDDDSGIRAIASRCGAITVPAEQVLPFLRALEHRG
jgi:hypothetical protein